jgi:hypothetical protein
MKNVHALAQKILTKSGKVAAPSTPTPKQIEPDVNGFDGTKATVPQNDLAGWTENIQAAPVVGKPTAAAPIAPTPVVPSDWPTRLIRLGILPLTPEEAKLPDWYERSSAHIKTVLKAERDRQVLDFGDPIPPPLPISELNESTVLDGKTLAEWDTLYETTDLPGWATWGLRHWRERGKPTKARTAKATYDALMEKANGAMELALLKEREAGEKATPEKQKVSLTKQAEKQRERHARLIAEAETALAAVKATS